MTSTIEKRARENGIEIPEPPPSGANHLPFIQTGNLLFISGQQPIVNGERKFLGLVGADISPEEAKAGCRVCALNMIGQVRKALNGDLDRVVRCVRIAGFVNAAPDFYASPDVIHGASEAIVEVFGDAGWHSRTAMGAGPLPFNVSVLIDGVWEIR